jgi:prepilin-type processing-associated H-X9-DG protein
MGLVVSLPQMSGDVMGWGDYYLFPTVLPLLGLPYPQGWSASVGGSTKGTDYMTRRHLAMWNVVFCDGHAEGLTARGLWYPSGSIMQRWYRDHQPHMGNYEDIMTP